MAISRPLSFDMLRAMPKVELHVHIESCLSAERIEQLALDAGVPMLRPREELFSYASLAEFLQVFEWWCDLLRTTDIAEQVAYDAAVQMSADGIVYADVLTGPRYWSHLDYVSLIEALGRGFERAHEDGYTDCRIVPSISREQPSEWAMGLVEWVDKRNPIRVVGLGLDGNEAVLGRTCQKFEHVYQKAADIGLGRTVHSGESSGPEGVWDALNFLQIDRVDHGVRAIEDRELVERLVTDQITLNVCPTSNVIVGLYDSVEENPIGRFIDAGIPVTVNSDDPNSMKITLSEEFMNVGSDLGWSVDDAVAVTRTAIDAAFCSQSDSNQLHQQMDIFVKSTLNNNNWDFQM
jgi:adenosine deaminase